MRKFLLTTATALAAVTATTTFERPAYAAANSSMPTDHTAIFDDGQTCTLGFQVHSGGNLWLLRSATDTTTVRIQAEIADQHGELVKWPADTHVEATLYVNGKPYPMNMTADGSLLQGAMPVHGDIMQAITNGSTVVALVTAGLSVSVVVRGAIASDAATSIQALNSCQKALAAITAVPIPPADDEGRP